MIDEHIRTWKDSVAACFRMIFRHFPRDTEENYENRRQDNG